MMAEYLPLHKFKAIYVVDLCHSLCEQAKRKVEQKSWDNVHVVEADACTFQPPEGIATLVTFSYSLSSKSCRARNAAPSFLAQANLAFSYHGHTPICQPRVVFNVLLQ